MEQQELARKAVEDTLFYYVWGLIQSGVEDPKQYVATELPKMINLTEEQIDYVKITSLSGSNITDSLDCSISLLKEIEQSKKLDMESLKLVINILEKMKEHSIIPSTSYIKEQLDKAEKFTEEE